jgi:hypothetical protein
MANYRPRADSWRHFLLYGHARRPLLQASGGEDRAAARILSSRPGAASLRNDCDLHSSRPPACDLAFARAGRRFRHALATDPEEFLSHGIAPRERSQSKLLKREKGIWQRRYWEHAIRDDADLSRHVDYIHFNPVKHGLVARVCDWPHSSFHRYVARGLLPADWGGGVRDLPGSSFGE